MKTSLVLILLLPLALAFDYDYQELEEILLQFDDPEGTEEPPPEVVYPPLESYNVDATTVSVSGISSGGSFTTNIHMAYSDFFIGAGIFAGSPFGCTSPESDRCTNITGMADYARRRADEGMIADVDNVQGQPVYVFHGENDWMVSPIQGERVEQFYQEVGADVAFNFSNPCGHGVPSLDYGVGCNRTWLPGVNKCDWSGAYAVMNHIYGGDLAEPTYETTQDGEFIEFDQTEFQEGLPRQHGFDEAGFVYIPSNCKNRESQCRLHLNIHGCFIVRWLIGDRYAIGTGHNEVGELNDIIVLAPMLSPRSMGCWKGGSSHDHRDAIQMRIVMKMINRILGLD